MTRSHITRSTATVLTAAVALGAAGSAAAQPIGSTGPVPVAPPAPARYEAQPNVTPAYVSRHTQAFPETTASPIATASPRAVVDHSTPGGSSDVVYILVGGVLVALSGVGGTLAIAGRRRTAPARARVAA